jgi:hypothetical protein
MNTIFLRPPNETGILWTFYAPRCRSRRRRGVKKKCTLHQITAAGNTAGTRRYPADNSRQATKQLMMRMANIFLTYAIEKAMIQKLQSPQFTVWTVFPTLI